MSAFSRFLNLFRSGSLGRDLDDEIQFHLQMRIDSNLRQGMTRMEAELEAHRRFGNVARVAEDDSRPARVLPAQTVKQGVEFPLGFRMMRGN